MFTYQPMDVLDASGYEALNRQLSHLLAGERDEVANYANTCALLALALSDINWVGFYRYIEARKELVLGPFQGKPACVSIAIGRGVCGTAAARRETVVVPDVNEFPGHIACDAESRSEIVVPIVVNQRVMAVLDIDSPIQNRFTDVDAAGLSRIVETLVQATDF